MRLVCLIALVAAGCTGPRPADPSVDGWPLGAEEDCEIDFTYGDPRYDVVAVASRKTGDVWAGASEARCYGEGLYLVDGKPFLLNRSGYVKIVVFTAADGSRRAVGLQCVGGCVLARPPS